MKRAKKDSAKLLTDVERRWYQCYAADILGGRFLREQFGIAFQLIFAGACGMLGVLWLDWSSEKEFAFILIGLWVGLARNIVKATCMYQGMQNRVKNFEATGGGISNIWYIVGRIQHPEIKNPPDALQNLAGIEQAHGKLRYQVICGTAADFVMGGICTFIMAFTATKGEFRFDFAALTGGGFVWAMAGFLGYEALLTAIQVDDFRRHRAERQVMMYPGFTGAGLLLIMTIVVVTNEPPFQEESTNWTMLILYAVIASWGFLNILWAILTWRKTVWLARQLKQKQIFLD